MSKQNDGYTRLERRKKKKADQLLNVLIGAVVVAIVVTALVVLPKDKEESKEAPAKVDDEEVIQQDENEEKALDDFEDDEVEVEEQSEAEETDEPEKVIEEPGDVEVTVDPNDPVVSESMVDPAWAPIGTTQQGEHVSVYDKNSVDWQEKIQALTYATGLGEDGMIVWKLKNGGSPQTSIGIVSSNDKVEKYRVYLEWVDNEGWQPVKMDILATLDFDY